MSRENAGFFSIRDYGAVPDGRSLCTNAFAAAIAAAADAGGGTVVVPGGNYLTGPIHLRSNINLHLQAGARVAFSRDPADYPLVRTRWEGREMETYSPQIYGEGLENVAVTGRGILDGDGENWWRMFRSGELIYPRPRFFGLAECRNVLIEGITILNSPAWTINPVGCENVTVDKVTIKNPADSPNTDGINPDSCRNVHISNCHVDVGDDCITLKSGKEDCADPRPCENITITNCTMVHGHGGVVIGSEMSGGVRSVVIANCVFEGTDRGIRIKTRRGRGGFVEDVRVANIVMRSVMCPIVFHMFYFCGEGGKDQAVQDKSPRPVTGATPILRRIHLSHITAREATACAGFIYGLPEMPVEEITLDDVAVQLAESGKPDLPAMMLDLEPMARRGFYLRHLKNAFLRDVRITGQEGPGLVIEESSGVEIAGCPHDTIVR